MKSLAIAASALALGAGLGLHGCAPERAAIQIQSICYPSAECSETGGCGTEFVGTPAISGEGTLLLILQVENQLSDNADPDSFRLNTNDAHVTGYEVEHALGEASLPTSAWLPAGSTGIVTVGIPVPALAPETAYEAKVRLKGYYDDDSTFETGDFTVPFVVSASVTACSTGAACPVGAGAQIPVACNAAATP